MTKAKKRIYRVKRGFGSHQMIIDGKRETYEPGGEAFEAFPHEVEGWEYKLEEVVDGSVVAVVRKEDEDEGQEAENVNEETEGTTFKMKHLGGGFYDVINVSSGKKINEKPLTKSNAEKLLVNGGEKKKKTSKKRSKIK